MHDKVMINLFDRRTAPILYYLADDLLSDFSAGKYLQGRLVQGTCDCFRLSHDSHVGLIIAHLRPQGVFGTEHDMQRSCIVILCREKLIGAKKFQNIAKRSYDSFKSKTTSLRMQVLSHFKISKNQRILVERVLLPPLLLKNKEYSRNPPRCFQYSERQHIIRTQHGLIQAA